MRKLIRDTILPYDFIAFQECNNNCIFCFQKNTANTHFTDEADVLERFDILLADIEKKHIGYKEVQIDMTGGELFFRKGLEQMYFTMFDKILELKKKINTPIRCLLGTNLLYEDTALLFNVLEYINKIDPTLLRGIFTSFDFAGRFRTIQKVELHRKNTLKLLDYTGKRKMYLAVVSVLTKEAIHKMMAPDDKLSKRIKEVYDEYYVLSQKYIDVSKEQWWFRLSWTLMSPNSISDEYTSKMVPSAEDICKFYKYLVDNYNTLAVVRAFYNRNVLPLRCGANCNVCKTRKIEKSCDSNIYGDELLREENLHVKSNDPIEIYKWLMEKYGCMQCKYFNCCYIRPCPVVVNLKTTEVGNFCWRKKIYEYVDEKTRFS